MTDTAFSLGLLGRDEWLRLHQINTNDHFDVSGRINPSEEEIRRKILRCTEGSEPHEIAAWPKAERDTLLRQLKEKEGFIIYKSTAKKRAYETPARNGFVIIVR
ncbi:hypothetical protein [Pelosinus baikalensis]|uniref:Uncharacterized protein n=1 Tax=Pelosinus baikalensis TaxID=2892015 RepID=A0ABS8HR53_9FIRM|nr:hypothetical protein [Pelosinus baikalensis]MCC5465663.1 hypothetical protein [Pelosinus baikalensis]